MKNQTPTVQFLESKFGMTLKEAQEVTTQEGALLTTLTNEQIRQIGRRRAIGANKPIVHAALLLRSAKIQAANRKKREARAKKKRPGGEYNSNQCAKRCVRCCEARMTFASNKECELCGGQLHHMGNHFCPTCAKEFRNPSAMLMHYAEQHEQALTAPME